MNFGFLFLFLLLQMGVNYVLQIALAPFLAGGSIYAYLAFYLLSSLIISFIAALFATPKGYKKDFYRHPGFHKTMLTYFIIFFVLDIIFLFI
jgi:hypothetical protein